MKLVDMAYTKAEVAEEKRENSTMEVPAYPWGLQIRLEEEEIAKLGIPIPQVGGELHLSVVAKVTGVSESTMADGEHECCVTLQITMMSVDLQESPDEERGEVETPASEANEMSLMARYRG